MTRNHSVLSVGLVTALGLGSLGCASDAETATASRSRASASSGAESADPVVPEHDPEPDSQQAAAPAARTSGDVHDEGPLPTAQDQSATDTDLAITRHIREACIDDDSLSWTARNVTIVTRDRVVTLRGNVGSAAERASIERHARAAPGVGRVDNRLAVDG